MRPSHSTWRRIRRAPIQRWAAIRGSAANRWRAGRGDRGSAAVELAITMPAILLALFASVQVAALFVARTVALTAAEQAVTAERAYQAPAGAGEQRANAFLDQTGDWLTRRDVAVGREGTEVHARVGGQALSLIPGMRFTVTQHAHGQIERFTTEASP